MLGDDMITAEILTPSLWLIFIVNKQTATWIIIDFKQGINKREQTIMCKKTKNKLTLFLFFHVSSYWQWILSSLVDTQLLWQCSDKVNDQ